MPHDMPNDTLSWLALGLMVSQWLLTVAVLRFVRSTGQYAEKRDLVADERRAAQAREMALMQSHMDVLRHWVETRNELDHLRQEKSA